MMGKTGVHFGNAATLGLSPQQHAQLHTQPFVTHHKIKPPVPLGELSKNVDSAMTFNLDPAYDLQKQLNNNESWFTATQTSLLHLQ